MVSWQRERFRSQQSAFRLTFRPKNRHIQQGALFRPHRTFYLPKEDVFVLEVPALTLVQIPARRPLPYTWPYEVAVWKSAFPTPWLPCWQTFFLGSMSTGRLQGRLGLEQSPPPLLWTMEPFTVWHVPVRPVLLPTRRLPEHTPHRTVFNVSNLNLVNGPYPSLFRTPNFARVTLTQPPVNLPRTPNLVQPCAQALSVLTAWEEPSVQEQGPTLNLWSTLLPIQLMPRVTALGVPRLTRQVPSPKPSERRPSIPQAAPRPVAQCPIRSRPHYLGLPTTSSEVQKAVPLELEDTSIERPRTMPGSNSLLN